MEHKLIELHDSYMMQVEAYLRLHVKPRPLWLPKKIHLWLLGKLVELEELAELPTNSKKGE